jgi:hypothetical protein
VAVGDFARPQSEDCLTLTITTPAPGDDVAADAVALFADRARAADAGFALTDQNSADVARLVGRLDGMPLAIELAAVRVEALGVAQLLGTLDGRLALLAGGDRLAAGRHRSLAAAAQWSYQLLGDREQRVFRLLSVFPAPFTLQAAEAVAGREATRWCCGWWSARCWSRRGPARTDGPGTRCWRRCARTGPGCWPGNRSRRTRRWPGTRCGWRRRPGRGC